jgi:hypothetical protein
MRKARNIILVLAAVFALYIGIPHVNAVMNEPGSPCLTERTVSACISALLTSFR